MGVATLLSAAGTAAGITGNMASAGATKAQATLAESNARIRRMQADTNREIGEVRALQTDAAFRQDLFQTLDNLNSIRASQNVGFDSQTSLEILNAATSNNADARRIAVSNEKLKAMDATAQGISADTDAALARMSGKNAYRNAWLKSVSGISSTIQSGYTYGQGRNWW